MLKLKLPVFQHFSDMKIYFKSRQITPYTVERDENQVCICLNRERPNREKSGNHENGRQTTRIEMRDREQTFNG